MVIVPHLTVQRVTFLHNVKLPQMFAAVCISITGILYHGCHPLSSQLLEQICLYCQAMSFGRQLDLFISV